MNDKIYSLEFLRFIAASLILFYHNHLIGFGQFGVDIFFIISGFVMMHSTKDGSRNFLLKRIIRIVPLYWLLTIIVFLFYFIFSSAFQSPDVNFEFLMKSLFFLPFDRNGTGHFPIVTVGWTLNYEFYFYILFWLACIISNKNRGVITVFFITMMLISLSFFNNFISSIYSDLIIMEFALGILLFYFMKKDLTKSFWVILLIFFSILLKFDQDHRFFLFGLPSFFIVALFIKFNIKIFKTNIIFLLGAISYSFYLSHLYVLAFFSKVINWIDINNLFFQVNFILISYIASIVISLILYKNFEIKIIKWLRRNFLRNDIKKKDILN